MREMTSFDTLCLHKCDTNMADSNRRQAVSHVSENQELRLIQINFNEVQGRKTWVPGEKPLRAEKITNKLNPSLEIEPGPHWGEASALTTTPPLLSIYAMIYENVIGGRGGTVLIIGITHGWVCCWVIYCRPLNREAPKINVTFGAHLALRHVEVNLILI